MMVNLGIESNTCRFKKPVDIKKLFSNSKSMFTTVHWLLVQLITVVKQMRSTNTVRK